MSQTQKTGFASGKTILTLLFLAWCVANINRFSINYAVLGIATDFTVNASMKGLIISSLFIGYAIMQIPGGMLADKFNPKKVLLAGVVVWSISAALTGVAWSPASIIAFRFLTGIGIGVFYPAATKTIALVFPRSGQGKAISVLLVSGAVIGAISSVLFAWIIGTMGWKALFLLGGACGVIIIGLYLPLFKVVPKIKEQTENPAPAKPAVSPIKQVIRVPMIWGMFIAAFCISLVTWGINSWIPTVLVEIRQIELMQAGIWQVIPLLSGVVAMLLCGLIIDKIKTHQVRIMVVILLVIAAISIYLMLSTPALVLFFIFESITIACITAAFVIVNNLVMRQFAPEVTGSAMGFVNFGAMSGAFVAPVVMGIIVDANNGSFEAAFIFLVIVATISVFAFIPKYFAKKDFGNIETNTAA